MNGATHNVFSAIGCLILLSLGTREVAAQTFQSVPDRLIHGGVEAAGAATRRGPIVLTEVHAQPAARNDGRDLRFIELYNSNPYPQRMGGWKLTGDLVYTFPAGYKMPGLSYLIIAPSPRDVESAYDLTGVLGASEGRTFSFTAELTLHDEIGAELFTFKIKDADPWPSGVAGTGHSLVLTRPTRGQTQPAAWSRSVRPGGSPGTAEPTRDNTYTTLLINELIPHNPTTNTGAIELINIGDQAVSLTGCRLVSQNQNTAYTFPANRTLAAHAVLAVDEATLGFAVSGNKDEILLRAPQTGTDAIIDAVRLPAVTVGGSYGRTPDGSTCLRHLATPTPGTRNASHALSPIVLNEIMYHPLDENKEHEYIELYNTTDADINLAGWVLSGDIDYECAETIPAHGYLVIANKRSAFRALYPEFTGLLGDDGFSGSLPNSSGTIRLRCPQPVWDAPTGTLVTNLVIQEEVVYRDGGAWGERADGGGSSLERIDPRSDPHLAGSWAASDESQTCGWKKIAYTGAIEYGRTGTHGTASQVELGLQDAGECLVDNVILKTETGSNLVLNPSFEDTNSSWNFFGTHVTSSIESNPAADAGSHVLHVRACARLHTGGNGIRGKLSSNLPTSGRGTISARVRWLGGSPDLLMRARGNWIEAFGDITTTHAFGTPGCANSRAANAAPTITEVTHEPLLPSHGAAVTVYARVADPDGLGAVQLNYHREGSSGTSLAMTPCEGGWFAGTIPAGTGNSSYPLVAFTVTATDASAEVRHATFPNTDPTRECLVRYGEPITSNTFGVYRFWITSANLSIWQNRHPDSNAPIPVTFISGNDRVIYTAGIQYGGSPFHCKNFSTPINNGFIDYKLNFPSDDSFLDDDGLVLASDGNSGNDPTVAKEQFCYALARKLGLPNVYRRIIHFYANGRLQNTRGVLEDSEKPNGSMIAHWFPTHTNGRLYKVDDWFEYQVDNFSNFSYDEKGATLESFKTTDNNGTSVYKQARYRWNWLPRACDNFAVNDYTDFFKLVDAINDTSNPNYEKNLAEVLDLDGFIGIPALQQFVGNYDAYGKERGKNAYIYNGPKGWAILGWDIDTSFGADNTRDKSMTDSVDPQSSSLKLIDPAYRAMLQKHSFARHCWRKTQALIAACTTGSEELTEYEDRYNALLADGVPVSGLSGVLSNIQKRRQTVINQMNAVDATSFTLTSPTTTDNNLTTLTGEAPFEIATILCNGQPLDVTWTSVKTWKASLTLTQTTTPLTLVGLREDGSTSATVRATLTYTGASLDTRDNHLVISGLLYNPAQSGGGYVEIYNASTTTTFDLTGVYLDGAVSYTFPANTLLKPGACVVVAEDTTTFTALYGSAARGLIGAYSGTLPTAGTLRLCRAAQGLELTDVLLDHVTWGGDDWPVAEAGEALRLRDPAADNNLAASWSKSTESFIPQGGRDLVPLNASWRYLTAAAPTGWKAENFDDSSWSFGPGPLGHDTNVEGQPINFGTDFSELEPSRITYYFRTTFDYTPASDQIISDNIFPETVTEDLANHNYLVHRWSFNGSLLDTAGGRTAVLCGSTTPTFTADRTGVKLVGGSRGTCWIDLGAQAMPNNDTPVTIEIWATQNATKIWGRVLDFGNSTTDYILIAWTQGTTLSQDAMCIKKIAGDYTGLAPFTLGTEFHISIVLQPLSDGTWNATFRKKEVQTGVTLAHYTINSGTSGWKPSVQGLNNCWLGHSQFESDNDAAATYNEVRIWNAALSDAQLTKNVQLGPDQLPALANGAGVSNSAQDAIYASYLIDDCAVVYLNGQELQRSERTPAGLLTDTTVALDYTPPGLEGMFLENFVVDPSLLHTGRNTLAVEVHQNKTGSSDVALGFILSATNSITGLTPPGRYAPDPTADLPAAEPESPRPPVHGTNDVTLNEFMAQNTRFTNPLTGAFDDWFELYNNGTNMVSLGGWLVTDTLKTTEPPTPNTKATKSYVLPASAVLAPGETLRIWTGAEDANLLPFDAANLQAPFGLAKSSDAIYLFDPATNLIDSVTYSTLQGETTSFGRWPNGTGAWMTFVTPTPGEPNHPTRFNTLSLRGTSTYTLRTDTSFTGTPVTNGTVPTTATFVLVPESGSSLPTGLSINAATGELTWAPSTNQTPGVYFLNLCSVVDGEATDALPITLTVLPPQTDVLIAVGLEIGDFTTSNRLTLTWNGRNEASYTIEWCDDLTTANWQPFPEAAHLQGSIGPQSILLDLTKLGTRKPKAFFRVKETK